MGLGGGGFGGPSAVPDHSGSEGKGGYGFQEMIQARMGAAAKAHRPENNNFRGIAADNAAGAASHAVCMRTRMHGSEGAFKLTMLSLPHIELDTLRRGLQARMVVVVLYVCSCIIQYVDSRAQLVHSIFSTAACLFYS